MADDPMDTDPIDGGPKPDAVATTTPPSPLWIHGPSQSPRSALLPQQPPPVTTEEEARQCIDKLRGDSVADRVEAAHRLDGVARVLGVERTRNVCAD